MNTIPYLLIALGGALGSVARFALSGVAATQLGSTFPWGTLIVNVLGSFVIGFFSAFTGPEGRWTVGEGGRMFFMTGVLGGFTTFSSFSIETFNLIEQGAWFKAAANMTGSLLLCVGATWVGVILGRQV